MLESTLRSADDGGTHHDVPRRLLGKKKIDRSQDSIVTGILKKI